MARSAATQRSIESAEAIEASARDGFDSAEDEVIARDPKRARVPFGVEKTAAENAVKLGLTKMKEAVAAMRAETVEIQLQLKSTHLGEGETDLSGGPLQISQELTTAVTNSFKIYDDFIKNEFVAWSDSLAETDSLPEVKQVVADMRARTKAIKSDPDSVAGKDMLTKTKRSVTNDLKKKSKDKSGMVAAGAIADREPLSRPPLSGILAQLFLEKPAGSGFTASVYESIAGITASRVVAKTDKSGASIFDAIRKNQFIKGVVKGCTGSMKERGTFQMCSTLKDIPKRKKIEGLLAKAIGTQMMAKMILPDEPWAQRIYQVEVYCATSEHVSIMPSNNCTMEGRLYLEGYDHVVGIRNEKIPGNTMAEKRHYLSNLAVDDLRKFITESNGWFMKMSADDESGYLVPSGHVLLSAHCDSSILRWGSPQTMLTRDEFLHVPKWCSTVSRSSVPATSPFRLSALGWLKTATRI